MRFMGLDVGDKRIGVAISDEGGVIATPTETVERESLARDIARITGLAASQEVSGIVVGLPLSMDGTEGRQAQKVRQFISSLGGKTNVSVIPWDERLTTVAAERALLEGDMTRARRRQVIDQVAAALILQSYLDYRRHRTEKESSAEPQGFESTGG
jgi:putative Holliday junction resolvase